MPLLMCPNCNAGMKQVTRDSVEIDVCPECRGVWLDRGELEKLIDLSEKPIPPSQNMPSPPPPAPMPPQQGGYYPPPYPDYYGGERHHGGGGFLRGFFGGGGGHH